jgi:nucleotide-binding universal stress UspA family protein
MSISRLSEMAPAYVAAIAISKNPRGRFGIFPMPPCRSGRSFAAMGKPATLQPSRAEQPRQAPSPFADIVCALDGSRGSNEAARQAIALCGPGTELSFVAISREFGVGLAAQAELSERRAREALDDAALRARGAGVRATTSLLRGTPVGDLLLAEAAEHELLVLGCHGGSRIGGIMLGSTATQIAHRAEGPVLVARRSADGKDFPQSVLLASDGSAGSWAAARVAARLAQAKGCELRLAYAPDGTHPERHRQVLKQLAMIERVTGATPTLVDNPGRAAERIGEAARAAQSSLIVIGRRGLSGVRALGSVSERVVHRAPCSVLAVPAGRDDHGHR